MANELFWKKQEILICKSEDSEEWFSSCVEGRVYLLIELGPECQGENSHTESFLLSGNNVGDEDYKWSRKQTGLSLLKLF